MCSPESTSYAGKAKLRNQISVLRAVGSSANPGEASSDLPTDDTAYISACQQMMHLRNIPLQLISNFKICPYLTAMTDDDENRLPWARKTAWVDLLTRVFLPQLY